MALRKHLPDLPTVKRIEDRLALAQAPSRPPPNEENSAAGTDLT